MLDRPLHFAPIFRSVIWGGDRIAPFKGISTSRKSIGESWEISAVPGHVSVVDRGPYEGLSLTELVERFGAELVGKNNIGKDSVAFPLLIKILDAKENLSVQVHPNDDLARRRHNSPGKTEIWRVIDAAPGAKIYTGLKKRITPEEYERRVADKSIMDVVATYDSAPGDTFFLPSGRIHALGAGNLVAEIQQTSDITYRIYDYDRRDKDGKPRELHTAYARDAIDYSVSPDYRTVPDADGVLASCDYFDVRSLDLADGESRMIAHPRDSFTITMCTEGDGTIVDTLSGNSFPTRCGDTLLFPAVMTSLRATGPLKLLTIQS